MWEICVFIFTLCHGQSQAERDVNKKTLKENLQKKSLIGRIIVYDTLIVRWQSQKLKTNILHLLRSLRTMVRLLIYLLLKLVLRDTLPEHCQLGLIIKLSKKH